MIIGSSMVSMQSERTYSSHQSISYASVLQATPAQTSTNLGDASYEPSSTTTTAQPEENPAYDAYLKMRKPVAEKEDDSVKTIHTLSELRMYLLEQLTRSLQDRRWHRLQPAENTCNSPSESFTPPENTNNKNTIYLSNVFTLKKSTSQFFSEKEVTKFSSEGLVKTADGRDISFNLGFEMRREFTSYSESYTEQTIQLCDPLVINYTGNVADLTDQYFYMDLDGDGEKEKIKQLAEGSGLLSLDLNGDGIINDGSELFGTKSGNGFEDLAEYDADHNGWIDEADDIFEKLTVYVKNADGSDKLLSLKEAGIGAIYLDSVRTEFAMKDENNDTEAVIKRSGIFLYENGGVGTVQQMDYAF